jgi:putative acetyltransferase
VDADVTVRPCGADDVEALEQHLPTGPAQVHASHFAAATDGRTTFLVAWSHDRPLGTVVVRWQGPVGEHAAARFDGVPEIAHLQVAVSMRGRGVGTALLGRAEDEVRRRGLDRVVLGVDRHDDAAARLYTRLGYVDTEVLDTIAWTWVDPDGRPHPTVETTRLLQAHLARPARPDEAQALHDLSVAAIRRSAAGYYTAAQLEAWVSRRSVEGHRWLIENALTVVGLVAGRPAGFVTVALEAVGDLEPGEVDQLFVHPDHAGRGVARLLLAQADSAARAAGLRELVTHASHRARPVFEADGWRRRETETVTVGAQELTRTRMTRAL